MVDDTPVPAGSEAEARYTVGELVELVNRWCAEARLEPANGQVGETLTERNARFYRTVGILDAPVSGGGLGYTERHALQLMALRLLQAQGLPLRRIRELLFGRSIQELRRIRDRGVAEARDGRPGYPSMPGLGAGSSKAAGGAGWAMGENWTVVPVNNDFAVICRNSHQLSAEVLRRLQVVLEEHA